MQYTKHEAVFVRIGPTTGTLQAVVVHNTRRGAGSGGIRNAPYASARAALADGLRLSHAMGRKSGLAGLWWGGGKAVVARDGAAAAAPGTADRARVFEEVGELVSAAGGCFVGAPDVGCGVDDVVIAHTRTRFVTCVPPAMGGSGSPAVATARGVVEGLDAAFAQAGRSLHGASIAIQGVGNVGASLIGYLLERGVGRVVGSVTSEVRRRELLESFAPLAGTATIDIKVVNDREDLSILFEDVDAVSPCATGGVLNADTIPQLRARIVCGAANNQLLEPDLDARLLHERGIIYVPDVRNNPALLTKED
ncbi:hypothetical protein HK405_004906 [Cladochytrium tenue]|nr:hypothetical protein HK405_004906 [Cladochytrium tenue]